MLLISRTVTILADFLLLFLFIVASLTDWVEGSSGLMMDHVIWKVLPIVILINLMYLACRLVARADQPNRHHEHREG